jgi:hypothetical protein
VKFPLCNQGRVALLDRMLQSSVQIRLLFVSCNIAFINVSFYFYFSILLVKVIYLTSVCQGGNVYQVANYLWARLFTDEFSMFLSWSQDCNSGEEARVFGHKDQQREFISLRSFAKHVMCLMYVVIRHRVVLSGRKLPSTFLINSALIEARKQAVTRYSRDSKKGGPIDFQKFSSDSTSPANFYIHSGNMEDDLAEYPDRLFDYHVSSSVFLFSIFI